MVEVPQEQLQAIADFWATVYRLDATDEQLQTFKDVLRTKVLAALQSCAWRDHDPAWGCYSRKFVTYHEFHSSSPLAESLEAAGLEANSIAFPCVTLSIDPGSVKIHQTGELLWTRH